MKTPQYRAEVAERYLEYLHSQTFAPRARERQSTYTRLAIDEIPFWKSIDIGALLTEVRQDNSDLFVNVSLEPDGYHSYLSRVVPYAETIVLADPIPTLYEWRDRSMVNDKEFDALLEQMLEVLLPLFPLIESGILVLLPQPLLWNRALDKHILEAEHKLLSNKLLVEALLKDHEEGLEGGSKGRGSKGRILIINYSQDTLHRNVKTEGSQFLQQSLSPDELVKAGVSKKQDLKS